MMNYLVYLVYGGDDYNNEALYSLLSYYTYHSEDENQIVMYTDDAAFFKLHLPPNVLYHHLDKEKITEWKGSINFVHRVKIKMLQDITEKYNGNILYLDTDTYFTRNISGLFEHISNNNLVFDKCEGKLADNKGGIARKMKKFLKRNNNFTVTAIYEPVYISEQFEVWNAGVIGFKSDYESLLWQVEELTDVLYAQYPLFVMEQIAFNYFFQMTREPLPAEKYIHHYWYFKEFRAVLKHFFEHNKGKTFTQLQQEISKINPEILSEEKRVYKKLTFWQRTFRKITTGKKWQMPQYKL